MKPYSYRERLLGSVLFQPADALPFRFAYGPMPGLLEEWHAQGLPASVQTREELRAYFGFDPKPQGLPLHAGPIPGFEVRTIEEDADHVIRTDGWGRTTKMLKKYTSLPLAIDHPVKDWDTWLPYKERLKFQPGRVGDNLEEVAAANLAAGLPNGWGSMGFYWFPRDLMGDETLCMAYCQDPELAADITNTWCTLIEQMLAATLERVRLDMIHFGEDMAYRGGPMIGPQLFDAFIRPCYERIRALANRYDVPILSVDTDGNLDALCDWFKPLGVNFIGPCEVQAGNDLAAMRARHGKSLAYDGGLDKRVLTQGRAAIDAMLERAVPPMMASAGGWVAALDHRVIPGTPLADFEYFCARVREMTRF